jgi:hypothetical protein
LLRWGRRVVRMVSYQGCCHIAKMPS